MSQDPFGELPRNWLIEQLEVVERDAVATAARLGSLIADRQEVIDAIQREMDKPVYPNAQTGSLEGRIVRAVLQICELDNPNTGE